MLKTLTLLCVLCVFVVNLTAQEVSPQRHEETRSIETYCHLCEPTDINRLLPKEWKVEKSSRLKLQWALETETSGRLTYFEILNPGECNPKIHILFQSKLETLEAAVRSWVKETER